MATAVQRRPATIEEALARSVDERVELIRGTLVEKEAVTGEHGSAQVGTIVKLGGLFQHPQGGGPGGWWFYSETDVQFGLELFRPDVCGFRREHMPQRARGRPLTQTPDWFCEILSTSNESRDRVEKLETYYRSGVPHYWLINPADGTLEVLRRTDIGYALVRTARRGHIVRAEPFDAVELSIDELLGFDPVAAE